MNSDFDGRMTREAEEIICRLKATAQRPTYAELETENHALKLAAAGGEDVPGSASMVTPADVEQWREEACRRERQLEAENSRLTRRAKAANQRADGAEARARLARVRAEGAEADRTTLRDKVFRLRIALHDAIRRPLGVTPDSALEFYDQRMADEAEARRPKMSDSPSPFRPRPTAPATEQEEG